jgi:transmembrane sensor
MNDQTPVIPFPRGVGEQSRASDWLAKLDRGDLTASERAAFEAWLAEDPGNKEAIRRIAGFWYGLDAPLRALYAESSGKSAPRRFAGTLPAMGRWSAAVAVVTLLAFSAFFFADTRESADETAYFSTDIGRSRQISLSDGSTITLNTNSILEQYYSPAQRTVRLVAGEAVFDVAHDPGRPFVVHAADGVIRAIGTRFSVRVDTDNVRVIVTEGRIALQQRLAEWDGPRDGVEPDRSRSDAGTALLLADPIIVQQGEIGRIHRSEGASKRVASERDVNENLSWVDGELVFFDRAFQSVVEEIERYTTVELRIEDATLKSRRVTGVIQIGDMDMMLDSIEQTLGVRVERVSPKLINLRS